MMMSMAVLPSENYGKQLRRGMFAERCHRDEAASHAEQIDAGIKDTTEAKANAANGIRSRSRWA